MFFITEKSEETTFENALLFDLVSLWGIYKNGKSKDCKITK